MEQNKLVDNKKYYTDITDSWVVEWSEALVKALDEEETFNMKHPENKINIEDYLCK